MRLFTSALIGATTFGLFASASPLEVRQDSLEPFQVTAVLSSSPPGRPGSTPWRYITANVTDPNSYLLTRDSHSLTIPGGSQGINCEAQWYRGESPQGRTWPCNTFQDGHWAMQVLPGTYSSDASVSDFKLRFIHAMEPGMGFQNTRYEAEASFLSGGNMGGRCASSGWCGYALSAAFKPVLAPAAKTL